MKMRRRVTECDAIASHGGFLFLEDVRRIGRSLN